MSQEKGAKKRSKNAKAGQIPVGLLSFTEKQVLKGISCCKTGGVDGCVGCPYYSLKASDCITTLMTHVSIYIEKIQHDADVAQWHADAGARVIRERDLTIYELKKLIREQGRSAKNE